MSPDLYSIYVDDLLKKLQSLQKGCYYLHLFAAAYFYADDIAIMAPSIKALKALLKECSEFYVEWDICLNAKKTKTLYFGRKVDIGHEIFLDGIGRKRKVEIVDEWVYLGVTGTKFRDKIQLLSQGENTKILSLCQRNLQN